MSAIDLEPGAVWRLTLHAGEHRSSTSSRPRRELLRGSEHLRQVLGARGLPLTDRAERDLKPGEIFGYFAGETPRERVRRRVAANVAARTERHVTGSVKPLVR